MSGLRPVFSDEYDRESRAAREAESRKRPNPLLVACGAGQDMMATPSRDEPEIVESFLYPKGFSLIVGEGGMGKTFALAQMMDALRSGKPCVCRSECSTRRISRSSSKSCAFSGPRRRRTKPRREPS